MKEIQLTIPSRIVYGPNISHGTHPIGGYSACGEKVRSCLFPEVGGSTETVECSYFMEKRVDSHHSNVTHCQVVTPPTAMFNEKLKFRYVNSRGVELLKTALGTNLAYRLAASGEEFCGIDPTLPTWGKSVTSRTWYTTYTYQRRLYAEARQEFASTLLYDKWGLSGYWPAYPCRDTRVRAIVINEQGEITNVGGTYFSATIYVYPSEKACSQDGRDKIGMMVRQVRNFHKNGRPGQRISGSFPSIGSFTADWKSWSMKPTSPQVYNYTQRPEGTVGIWPSLHLQQSFRFGEPSWVFAPGKKDIAHLDADVVARLKTLQSEAFLNAAEDIPIANQNAFQTFGDLIGILSAVRRGEYSNVWDLIGRLPKSWQDTWLAYRYSYNTNRMDIKEFISFVRRTQNANLLGTMSIKGSTTIDGVTCRCQAVLQSQNVRKVQKALYLLDRYGLCPDFYIVWDSIPYSFMIDWLVPIGEMVSRTDAQIRYSKLNYDIKYISYSLSYRAEARLTKDQRSSYGDLRVNCYTRWQERSVPDLAWFHGNYEPSHNKWVWTKRGLDFIAIFFGKK